MVQRHLFNHFLARTAGMLSGARRGAMMLVTLMLTLTAQTAQAEDIVTKEHHYKKLNLFFFYLNHY